MSGILFKIGLLLARLKWAFIVGLLGLIGLTTYAWHQFFLAHSRIVPAKGGIFTETTIGTVRNYSPFTETSSLFDRTLRRLIFTGLVQYDPVTGQIESGLAGLRISEDGKTYFLTLKDAARFQDGDSVTTDDVIFTFEKLIQNPNFPNQNLHDAFEYVTIDVVDEKTLAFHIPERNIFFPPLLTVPIVPEKYFKDVLIEEVVDPDFPFNKKPIGTGPFSFERIVPNDDGSFRVFLRPNPYFYAGEPNLEQIVFYVFPNFEHLKFAKSWTTVFSRVPYREKEKFESQLFGEYIPRQYILPRFAGLFFNLDRPLAGNLYFRQALNKSIDKEKVLGKEKVWNRVDSPFFFEGIEGEYEPDFSEGREILRDHGFPYKEELGFRVFDKGEEPASVTMITSTNPPVYSRFGQKIVQTWNKELDLDIKLEILSPEEFKKALEEREYDIVLFGQDFSENFDTLSLWHSSQSGKLNLSNLTRDDIDFLIDEIRFYGAQSDLLTLNKKLSELVPAIILATPKYDLLISRYLKGFSETFGSVRSHADRFTGVQRWYFDEKLDWNLPEEKGKVMEFLKWSLSRINFIN